MEKKYCETNIHIRYAETDAMGVVHHANYYIYFEKAREDLISSFGITYFEMEKMGVITPIIETQCKHINPAKYGDIITIKSYLDKLTPIKFEISYEISKDDKSTIIAKGKTTLAFADKQTFKLINLKKFKPDIWKIINKN